MTFAPHLGLADPRALRQKLDSLAGILAGDTSLDGMATELKTTLEKQLADCPQGVTNEALISAHDAYDALLAELMVRSCCGL
jgi:hypothetical protein